MSRYLNVVDAVRHAVRELEIFPDTDEIARTLDDARARIDAFVDATSEEYQAQEAYNALSAGRVRNEAWDRVMAARRRRHAAFAEMRRPI